MIVVIVRHGKAERQATSGADADRTLKNRGHRQAAYLAAALAGRADGPVTVISSPFTRARQTAEVLAAALRTPLLFDDRLESGRAASEAIEAIARHGSAGGFLVLVGHNPQLSDVACLLARGSGCGGEALRTGEAVLLRVEDWAQPVGGAEEIERLRLPDDGPAAADGQD